LPDVPTSATPAAFAMTVTATVGEIRAVLTDLAQRLEALGRFL
jgi:hypothetical protein